MLTEDVNMQKHKKREEQLRNWRERENAHESNNNNNSNNDSYSKLMLAGGGDKKEPRVRFPKSCVFLAACSSGDVDEVRHYLKLGVNINTTNIDGLTALHQACIDANIEMVKFLIENAADTDVQDNEGWTPLHAAVSVGNLEVVKYLVSRGGARLDICNNDSDLPVDLVDATTTTAAAAAIGGNVAMRDYLLEEMRVQEIDGEFEKQKEELLMLEDAQKIEFRERVHAKTGATPLHVAAAKGYLRVIE